MPIGKISILMAEVVSTSCRLDEHMYSVVSGT